MVEELFTHGNWFSIQAEITNIKTSSYIERKYPLYNLLESPLSSLPMFLLSMPISTLLFNCLSSSLALYISSLAFLQPLHQPNPHPPLHLFFISSTTVFLRYSTVPFRIVHKVEWKYLHIFIPLIISLFVCLLNCYQLFSLIMT